MELMIRVADGEIWAADTGGDRTPALASGHGTGPTVDLNAEAHTVRLAHARICR